jgi:RES domain-containing protein
MKSREADRPLYRIGRRPNAWAWPDWLRASADGTFGNRWDDPDGAYRVLYAASSLRGAFVEVLARFRPDPHVAAELARIDGRQGSALPPGHLDPAWLEVRCIGEATVRGSFAEIGHSASLARIQKELALRLAHYGIQDLDGSAIRVSAPRRLTQEISRFVFEQTARGRRRAFDGISYLSRLGDELRNWALFEPIGKKGAASLVAEVRLSRIGPRHPELRGALELLGIVLAE